MMVLIIPYIASPLVITLVFLTRHEPASVQAQFLETTYTCGCTYVYSCVCVLVAINNYSCEMKSEQLVKQVILLSGLHLTAHFKFLLQKANVRLH